MDLVIHDRHQQILAALGMGVVDQRAGRGRHSGAMGRAGQLAGEDRCGPFVTQPMRTRRLKSRRRANACRQSPSRLPNSSATAPARRARPSIGKSLKAWRNQPVANTLDAIIQEPYANTLAFAVIFPSRI